MRVRRLAAVLAVLVLPACASPGSTAPAAPGVAPPPPALERPLPSPSSLPSPSGATTPAPAPAPTSAPAAPPSPGAHADPAAPDVVVNKQRPLSPLDFEPAELRPLDGAAGPGIRLRPDAAAAVERMVDAAGREGVGLVIVSGYRSYAEQQSTYAHWVAQYGSATGADAVSARPGYSEHQTGLAFDIAQDDGACTLVSCFAQTRAARWTALHASEYGIILRYPLGFDHVTGFFAEPWHFRYVGPEVALAMKDAGRETLEEYFGLPAAPSY